MDNDFDVQGYWWLPESPDLRLPGRLSFTRKLGARLALLGGLRSPLDYGERTEIDGTVRIEMTQSALERSGIYDRINGEADGCYYTLDDCFQIHSTNRLFGGTAGSQVIHANRVFKGAQFDAGEPVEVSGISFSTRCLANWITETGITETWNLMEDDTAIGVRPRFVLEVRDIPARYATTSSGMSVGLKQIPGIAGNRLTERSLTQLFWWEIQYPSKASLDLFIDLASDLQDLVSIATNHIAAFESMQLWHPDIYFEGSNGKRLPQPVELYVVWNADGEDADLSLNINDLLFTFEQFGGMAGVHRWLEVAENHRTALGRVMASRYARTMFVSDRLLNCAAALESFDRTRSGLKQSKFRTRLNRCAELAGVQFGNLVGDVPKWTEAVRAERDDVAHNFGLSSKTMSSRPYFLWQSLYWLFVLCILREGGAPAEVYEQLETQKEYCWLLGHVRDAVV